MENLIEIGDYVFHEKYGYGKIKGWDGSNIIQFVDTVMSCFDKELTKVTVSSLNDALIEKLNLKS